MEGTVYNEEDFDDMQFPECPACGEINLQMGILGKVTWYRCRYCGMEYNGGVRND